MKAGQYGRGERKQMKIRKSTEADLDRMMKIYARARAFMAGQGNPNQWGPTHWPPAALIRQDIRDGNSYVCVDDQGKILGTFFFHSRRGYRTDLTGHH